MNSALVKLAVFFCFYAAAIIITVTIFDSNIRSYRLLAVNIKPYYFLDISFSLGLALYIPFLVMEFLRSKENLKFTSSPVIVAYVLSIPALLYGTAIACEWGNIVVSLQVRDLMASLPSCGVWCHLKMFYTTWPLFVMFLFVTVLILLIGYFAGVVLMLLEKLAMAVNPTHGKTSVLILKIGLVGADYFTLAPWKLLTMPLIK